MIRAALRLSVYLLFTLACMPFQAVFVAFGSRRMASFPVWYHGWCLWVLGIRVVVDGSKTAQAPCLFVSNHSSYLDIPVLGSLIPGCFVAKAEVAGWPLFGWLAKLQRTLFIDRRVSKVGDGQSALAKRLQEKDNLVLFPEGTSSDGVRVLPFRRALFQTILEEANGKGLVVQPVTISCVAINGLPADRAAQQLYAWFGDMDLAPHLWAFAHLKSCTVRVVFHPVQDVKQMADRKVLAAEMEKLVATGLR